MEKRILKVALTDRDSYYQIREFIEYKTYSQEFQALIKYIENFYETDPNCKSIDTEVLKYNIKNTISSDKQYDYLSQAIDSASILDTSTDNVSQTILSIAKVQTGHKLAVALTNHDDTKHKNKIPELLAEYNKLDDFTTPEAMLNDGLEIINGDFSSLKEEFSRGNSIPVAPVSLSNKLDGGLPPGSHTVIFGRPESGKSTMAISIAAGFLRQGHVGIYFINEDRAQAIASRFITNLLGKDKYTISANFDKAIEAATRRGLDKLHIIELAPGNFRQIEACIKKIQPAWIVIDQIRNLNMKADSRVNTLEAAATEARNTAKRHKLIGISVTQAGDSGTNKEYLEMGDVDFSNTGIPAQADLMIGVGVNESLDAAGLRGISLCKNKISTAHHKFYLKIDAITGRFLDLE